MELQAPTTYMLYQYSFVSDDEWGDDDDMDMDMGGDEDAEDADMDNDMDMGMDDDGGDEW